PPRFDAERRVQPGAHLRCELAREGAHCVADPALLAEIPRLVTLDAVGLPQRHRAGPPAMGAEMAVRAARQAERLVAEPVDHPIDDLEDRRRGAEALVHRQVEKLAIDALRLAREPGAGVLEALGIGPLKAEDRLLEVADGEDGPVAIA